MLKEKVYTDFVLILTYVTTRCLSPKNKSSAKKIGTSTVPIPILKKISYHEIHIFKIPGGMENQKLKKENPNFVLKTFTHFYKHITHFPLLHLKTLDMQFKQRKNIFKGN